MPNQSQAAANRQQPAARDDLTGTRVVKTVRAHQSGRQRWHRQFGEQLLCVRYREVPTGQLRHVTVELLVEEKPIRGAQHPVGNPSVQVYCITIGSGFTCRPMHSHRLRPRWLRGGGLRRRPAAPRPGRCWLQRRSRSAFRLSRMPRCAGLRVRKG